MVLFILSNIQNIILNTPFYHSGLHVDNGVKLFFIVGVEPGHDFYQ